MKAYLFEIRESDGNDCTVYDCIIMADNAEDAKDELATNLEAKAKQGNWESDGNFGGYYLPCDCENEEPEELTFPCDQCASVAINGLNCHETGCPKDAEYRRELKVYERFECQGHGGLMVSEEPEEYPDYETADRARSRYHSLYTI